MQVGVASGREQYVHRIGRTARAGKPGGGFLLLAECEAPFLTLLADLLDASYVVQRERQTLSILLISIA